MAKNDMNFYATLEEAIDAAREVFLADNPDLESDDASVQQLSVQKYVLQDGDIMWQAEFFADEDDVDGECLPILSGEAAQMKLKSARSGRKKIRFTNGMKVNSSWNLPLILKRDRPQPMNGMSDNYS